MHHKGWENGLQISDDLFNIIENKKYILLMPTYDGYEPHGLKVYFQVTITFY